MTAAGAEHPLPPVRADEQDVDAALVAWATRVVASTGLVADIEEWTAPDDPRGRKRSTITVEGFLVSMLLVVTEGKPALLNHVEAMAHRRVPVKYRQRWRTDRPTGTRRQRQATYKNVRDCFHRICRAMDPSNLPKNRRMTWTEMERWVAANPPDPRWQATAHDRLGHVTERLLRATYETLPRYVRRRWKGSVAVDGTKVPVFAVGRDYDGTWESTDPDAGWHTRTDRHEHHGVDDGDTPERSTSSWAYEAHLAVMAFDEPVPVGGRMPYPTLCLGMDLGKPSTAPGRRAMTALGRLRSLVRDSDPDRPDDEAAGWLGVDRAYTSLSSPDDFHRPVADLGYTLVFDYRADELGRQGSADGAVMVEGHWYCGSMPDRLADATVDYRAGRITWDQWTARLDERRAYEFKRYGSHRDGVTRMTCPASGPVPTASCPLKRSSQQTFGLALVQPTPVWMSNPATACMQKTVSVPDGRALRFRQHLRYKSREWQAVYGMLRNCVEGFNGTVKDGRGAALADPTRRRVRGIAPQWLLCTFLLVGENLRRIRRWQDESDTDRHGRMTGPAKVARGARRADDIARWEAEVDERVAQGLPIRSPIAEKRDRKRRRRKPKPPGSNG